MGLFIFFSSLIVLSSFCPSSGTWDLEQCQDSQSLLLSHPRRPALGDQLPCAPPVGMRQSRAQAKPVWLCNISVCLSPFLSATCLTSETDLSVLFCFRYVSYRQYTAERQASLRIPVKLVSFHLYLL